MVTEARERGWAAFKNGDLLSAAEEAGFAGLLISDKNIAYRQNLAPRTISIVVLGQSSWWLVRQHLDAIVAAVNATTPGNYTEVEIPFG